MAVFTAESDFGVANLTVTDFSVEFLENGMPSNNVIHIPGPGDPASEISWKLTWKCTGAGVLHADFASDFHFHPRIYLEKMGPGDGPIVPPGSFQTLVQGAPSTAKVYTDTITLNANRLVEGAYQWVLTLNLYKVGHGHSIFHSFYNGDDLMFEATPGHDPMP